MIQTVLIWCGTQMTLQNGGNKVQKKLRLKGQILCLRYDSNLCQNPFKVVEL